MDDSFADLNVQTARRKKLAKDLAAATGLSVAAVRGRLRRAHGRKLLRNLFADVWGPTRRSLRESMTPTTATPAAERTIHRVRQQFSTSCGVAVVAMFARVSHAAALAVMFPEPRRVFYTHLRDVKRALDHFGVRYGSRWHRFHTWDQIPSPQRSPRMTHLRS